MKKLSSKLLAATTLLLVAISFYGFYTLGANRNQPTITSSQCPVDACVSLSKSATQSQVVTVTAGSYVQFSSADGAKHNIALVHSGIQHEDTSRYESGDFSAGTVWKVQFKQDGSFTFQDKYFENIEVSVVVYTPGKDYKIQL